MVLALFNVEFRSWGTVVFVPVIALIAYVFLTQPVWTFIVGAAALLLIAALIYYTGLRADRRLRHGGGR